MIAAQKFGRFIQQTIFDRTGFTTTLGISTSPLLAKLATDLNKPMSLNVLFPWRSSSLIASMPLRKIPDAGRRTIQLLNPALEKFHGAKKAPTSFWTCQ
jgi:nucleotidyltransferase/DNA polymerase involved in DNA repair